MAEEAVNKEYEEAQRKVDESFEGKIFVRYRMPDGKINNIIYFSVLSEFKREIEKGESYLANNLVDFGIIRIQETEGVKRIKLEEIDLSKIPLESEDDEKLEAWYEREKAKDKNN